MIELLKIFPLDEKTEIGKQIIIFDIIEKLNSSKNNKKLLFKNGAV